MALLPVGHVELVLQNDNAATVVLHLVVVSVFHLHPNVGGLGRAVYDLGAILLVEAEERCKRPGSAGASISTRPALGNEVETRGRAAGFVQGTRLADAITLGIVFSLGEQDDFFDIGCYCVVKLLLGSDRANFHIMLCLDQERGISLNIGHVVGVITRIIYMNPILPNNLFCLGADIVTIASKLVLVVSFGEGIPFP